MSSSPSPIGRTAGELQRLLADGEVTCAVCGFVADSMRRHVDSLFYERVTDIATREAIRAAGGFCRRHARLVWEQADALGTALILQDVLVNQLRVLDRGEMAHPPRTTRGLGRLLESVQGSRDVRPPCPLCPVEREMETLAVDDLLHALADETFRKTFEASRGLCLPHFRLAYDRCDSAPAWAVVVRTEGTVLAELASELGELARKQDYRFRGEELGAEADSWRRALNVTSGSVDA